MEFVFARGKIDCREILRGNLPINRHRKSYGHKWARGLDEEPELLIPRELPMIEAGRVKAAL